MITYGSTTLTSYNTITKIEVYYYKSTSATSLSGGSWSTTKPTWENGKYIWQKIRTTYEGKLENGQYYSESNPVNITGQQGTTGTAAYSYKLNASDTSITVSKNGTYSKTSVTFSATSKQGTGTVNAYAGWFKIETTANGTTWTTQYTSSANESSKEYTIPTGILNIRCSLYQAGGTSVLLDIVSVAIVKDGIDGASQNLLLDVYATSLAKVKAPWNRYFSNASNTTITSEFIAEDNLPDPNATYFIRFTDSSATTKGMALCFYSGGTPPFLNGHTYKVGCWVRKHAGQPGINIYLGSVFSWTHTKTITNTEWEWVECVHTFGDTDPSINAQPSTYKRLYFYFYNKNVEGSSLDMCGFKAEEIQINISTARNYLLKTKKLEGWGVTNGTTINNGIATFPEVSANTWREVYSAKNFKYELIRNKNIIFSVKVKADMNKICCCNLCIGVDSTETAYARQKYALNPMYFTGTADWQTICLAVPMSDEYFTSGSGTPDYDDCWVTVRIGAYNNYWNGFQIKEPQLSLGTTATAWSAAPEDIEANMQEKVDNLEIGGRNLLPFKDCPSKTLTKGGITLTKEEDGWIRVSGTRSGTSLTTFTLWQNPDGSTYTAPINSYVPQNGNTNQFTLSVETEGTPFIMGDTYINSTHIVAYGSTSGTSWRIGGINGTSITDVFPTYMSVIRYYVGANSTGTVNGRFRVKLERGNKATNWTPAPEDVDASIATVQSTADTALSQSVEYIVGTQTAATGNWTGEISENELRDGKTIMYKLPFAGSGDASLQLTLANGTLTNNIPVYMVYSTSSNTADLSRVTTHYPANSILQMTYDATANQWKTTGYNTNVNNVDRSQYGVALKASDAISAARIAVLGTDDKLHILNTTAFKTTCPPLYVATAYNADNVTSGTTRITNYRYWGTAFNLTSTHAITGAAAGKPVYIVGTYANDIFTPNSKVLTCTQPTTEDGLFYMRLGTMSTTTNAVLEMDHEIYVYYDGAFLKFEDAEAQKAKKTATNYMSSDNTGIMVADLKDGEQLPANATGENVFITAGYGEGEAAVDMGVHIRNGQEDLAIFGESTRIGKENDSNVSIDNNGIIINKGSKELAKYSSKGIVFDEEIPYKIGNDNSYISFEDTDNDNKADSLNIVADSIYFRDTANVNIKDTLNGLQSDLSIAQEDIDLKNNYIKINTSEPSIIISASSNTDNTNLKLESSQLSFQINGQTTATIANDQMNIPTASVTNLFMQSANTSTNIVYEKVWVMRTNGHLSLKTITRN